MSNFLCLWIPQFPAWALAQSEFALTSSVTKGESENLGVHSRPFAVSERGVVIAASPQALEAGIQLGISIGRAQTLCPQLLVVPRDKAREDLAWAEVQHALSVLNPHLESVEPGLLFAGIEAQHALPLVAKWNAQAGQAQDRATAHLVALTATAGEVRCLRSGRESSFADRVPLETLCAAGLSTRSLDQLKKAGWKSVGGLRIFSQLQLEEMVGSQGALLYRLAQGGECLANVRPLALWVRPEELAAKCTLAWPAREACDWEPTLQELVQNVWQKLDDRSAQSLEIIVQTPFAPVARRRLLKEPLSQLLHLEGIARSVLEQSLQTLAPLPPVILGIEVRLGHLVNTVGRANRPNRLKAALERVETRLWGKSARLIEPENDVFLPDEAVDCMSALEELRPRKAQKLA